MRAPLAFPALVVALSLSSGCAGRSVHRVERGYETPAYQGPDTVRLDLVRPGASAPRVFVYATLPDGEPGLFQIDTGASISVLSEATADRLGLAVRPTGGFVEGLSGRAPLAEATVPELSLGEAVLHDVDFAVGVPGVYDRVGAMALDGILGNNVWQHFVLDIDYPADVLSLHRPGSFRMPRRSTPLFFDGGHILAPVVVTSAGDVPIESSLYVQLDTGAGELWLIRDTGRAFAPVATEGIEPVYGIGASEVLPPTQYLKKTRRIPLHSVEMGGRTVHVDFDAAWLGFEPGSYAGPASIRGLAGHELFADYRALFDYRDGLFALKRSTRRARQLDGHALALDQDIERFGNDAPERAVYRAELSAAMGDLDQAEALLQRFTEANPDASPDRAEAVVLLARIRRSQADLSGASEVLAELDPADLIEQDEIGAAVNGLVLQGRIDEALALAERAAQARPDAGAAHVALADALLGAQRFRDAEDSLITAAELVHNPDAHLIRRARLRSASGDRMGAMALMRRLIELYPTDGLFLWFYTLLLDGPDDELAPTLRHDLDAAMARLHPQQRPFDFLVAAYAALGEQERAESYLERGLERDCREREPAESDNCVAWYLSLAQRRDNEPLHRIEAALARSGPRSDFLDTKAMVHLARGELLLAHEAAQAAARLAPDDVYMLWQAERLAAMSAQAEDDASSQR